MSERVAFANLYISGIETSRRRLGNIDIGPDALVSPGRNRESGREFDRYGYIGVVFVMIRPINPAASIAAASVLRAAELRRDMTLVIGFIAKGTKPLDL